MRRILAQRKELRLSPPPEFFLAGYFQGRDWWHPPNQIKADAKPQVVAASLLPEFEE
jgi:hypothetical protein